MRLESHHLGDLYHNTSLGDWAMHMGIEHGFAGLLAFLGFVRRGIHGRLA